MSHLNPESLARLVDERAESEEQAHLDTCAECRAMLAELSSQTAALAALPALSLPGSGWDDIATRLRESEHRRQRLLANVARAAAAIALFAIGAASGVMLSRDDGVSPDTAAVVATDPIASDPTLNLISTAAPKTMEEATARLRMAETMYTRALLDYAALTSPQPPLDPVARLATLEAIVLTTRAALERAPADPLINTYHLAAQAERESLLGQLRRRSEAGQWY